MDPKLAKSIFLHAVEQLSAAEWPNYVDHACGNDTSLRHGVKLLLLAHQENGDLAEQVHQACKNALPSVDLPVAEKPGAELGPYTLLQEIGQGGMGVVYAAEQREPIHRKVALKIIKPGMDTRQVIARFEAERQALSQMDHPNIAKALDAGTTESGRPYFVMELVNGQPITEYCDEKHFTLRQRLELLLPVCQSIQHAHQKGIVHRDIKPSNILVAEYDQQAVPKVIDFGVAKAIGSPLNEKTMFTGVGQIIGTLEYMSPEQAKVNQLDIDTRSDIYSLGVLMYELLTGSTPFDKERLRSAAWDEMLRIIREEEPPRPSTKLSSSETLPSVSANRNMETARLSRTVRGELDWIVMKALEKDRSRRYKTAEGLGRDIERYLRNEPVEAGPLSAAYRTKKFIRRNKGTVIAATILLLTLVGGVVSTTWGLMRAEKALSAEAERAEGERRAKEESQTRMAQIEKGTEILASVFRDLDPIVAEKAEVTSRDLICRRLSEAAHQLDAVGDPLVVARLQHALGISLRELKHLDQAEAVLIKAHRTRERMLGPDNLDTVATTHELATLYLDLKKYEPAEAMYKDALTVRTARLGADDLDTVNTKHHLAWLYRFQIKFALAEALCQEVLAVRTARLGATNLETVAAKSLLAVLYHHQGKNDLAEPLFKEVLAIRTEKLGANHSDNLTTRHYLALLYRSQGKLDLAESFFRDLVSRRMTTLEAGHVDIINSKYDLAGVYHLQGKHPLAEEIYKEVMADRIAKLGADHLDTLLSQYNLATVYRSTNRLDKGISLLEDVLRRGKTLRHPAILLMQADLVDMYCDAGRFADAELLLGDALKDRTDTLGVDHAHTRRSRDRLAQLYRSTEKFEQAIPLLRLTLEQRKAIRDPNTAEILGRQVTLGATYCDAGQYADGIALIEAVRDQRRDDPHPAWVRSVLLKAYLQAGRFSDAAALVTERVRDARGEFPADSPDLAAALAENGKLLVDAKAYAEAESLLLEVYKRLSETGAQITPPVDTRLLDVVKRLVQLYDAWGKPDKAAKLRKDLEVTPAADRAENLPGH
jgi:serine/threonine protein kinase/tetratricopeptide (TPR) repeat protein